MWEKTYLDISTSELLNEKYNDTASDMVRNIITRHDNTQVGEYTSSMLVHICHADPNH